MGNGLSNLLSSAEQQLRRQALASLNEQAKDWEKEEREEAAQILRWWFSLADEGR